MNISFLKNMFTKVGNTDIKLYRGPLNYNMPSTNERTIELGLGEYFISTYKNKELVELGAVMPYYGHKDHVVYDLHDPYENCIRKDFVDKDISFAGKSILSLSTMEHIGFNDYSKNHGRYPIDMWSNGFFVIDKIINEADNYLITIPIGYNPVLDSLIQNKKYTQKVIRRISNDNRWEVDEDSYNMRYLYGYPQLRTLEQILGREYIKYDPIEPKYNNANAICVMTNDTTLLS